MSDKSIKEIIAKNLQLYRKKQGLTQKELAAMLNVRGSAISNWETGANSIDIDTLVRACEIFGTTINDMYEAQSTSSVTMAEYEIIQKYRTLDEYGKRNVDNILENEYERCADSNILPMQETPSPYKVHTLAAHELPDATEEGKKHDYDLLEQIKKGLGGGKRE